MNYDIVGPHVSEWLEDDCDRTEHDFAMEYPQPLTEDEIDELQMQEPFNNISRLPAEEFSPDEPTKNQPTYINTCQT